ncbi:hypothetical protein [Listeria seeligeri]|nr:hypothetical protein [Listeria seeligeri]
MPSLRAVPSQDHSTVLTPCFLSRNRAYTAPYLFDYRGTTVPKRV